MHAGENVEKRECKLIQPLWRTLGRLLKKLGIKLPYDPAIPLLGIYPEKMIIEKDTHTPLHWSSLQNYLQKLGHGSNLDIHRQMSG